jgi:hypothetical protein
MICPPDAIDRSNTLFFKIKIDNEFAKEEKKERMDLSTTCGDNEDARQVRNQLCSLGIVKFF